MSTEHKERFLHSTVSFKRGRTNYSFDVVHNLTEAGSSIDAALMNWVARTDTFTVRSFCDYVESKDPENIVCVPKAEFYRY